MRAPIFTELKLDLDYLEESLLYSNVFSGADAERTFYSFCRIILSYSVPPQTINIRLDPKRLRQWHLRLLGRIEKETHCKVSVSWGQSVSVFPSAAELLFDFECIVHRAVRRGAMALVDAKLFDRYLTDDSMDLMIDLCGDMTRSRDNVWKLMFDGGCGEGAALNALVHGIPPYVEICELNGRRTIASAHPGTEYPGIMVAALSDVMARTTTLILAAIAKKNVKTATPYFTPQVGTNQSLLKFTAKSIAREIAVRLYHLCYNTPHWKVGFRFFDGKSTIEAGEHPADGWKTIADDGGRFYADPFPLYRNGRYHAFVEDFDHKLGYGVVSAIELKEDGSVGDAKTVLDTGSHLSYPFIFEAEGQVWMIPESSLKRNLELFRASTYPDKWVKEATLLDNIEASDATIFAHEGRWWMMATVRDDGGNYSDTLYIWTAPDFRGPWTPLPNNPVLIDVACSRPAGAIVNISGELFRPVQDCTVSYGHHIAIARITQLSLEGYSQTLGARLTAGPLWTGRRLHTYNASGRLEMIDGSSAGRKFF